MGRQGETYGEDPTLAAELGVAFVDGLQQGGSRRGCVRRRSRSTSSASTTARAAIHGAHCDIPDRLLVEVYGKPFQAAITLSGLRGIMPCYGSVAGEPVSSSRRILSTMLRRRWASTGVAVSDYGAIGNLHTVQHAGGVPPACRACRDDRRHGRRTPRSRRFDAELLDWFADGRANVSVLDRAVHRMLTAKFRMGLFEHPFALDGAEWTPGLPTPVTMQSRCSLHGSRSCCSATTRSSRLQPTSAGSP